MILVKPFLQMMASVFLIYMAVMIHYDYYKDPSSTSTTDIFPVVLLTLLIGFLGLHYAIFQTLMAGSLLVFFFAFVVTANHLLVSREKSVQRHSMWSRVDVLFLALGWLVLASILHPDPVERVFLMMAMLFILILWVKGASYYRARRVSDHPVYALMMLAWVFIAYRLTKTDF